MVLESDLQSFSLNGGEVLFLADISEVTHNLVALLEKPDQDLLKAIMSACKTEKSKAQLESEANSGGVEATRVGARGNGMSANIVDDELRDRGGTDRQTRPLDMIAGVN